MPEASFNGLLTIGRGTTTDDCATYSQHLEMHTNPGANRRWGWKLSVFFFRRTHAWQSETN